MTVGKLSLLCCLEVELRRPADSARFLAVASLDTESFRVLPTECRVSSLKILSESNVTFYFLPILDQTTATL